MRSTFEDFDFLRMHQIYDPKLIIDLGDFNLVLRWTRINF